MRQLLSKIKLSWPHSRPFRFLDKLISKRFQRNLRNDSFTILSSNCIGGVIYHRLGKQFLSPTINMWFRQPDFVSFCLHLDYYLRQKLSFYRGEESYPTAELRGTDEIPTIRLYFNHAKTEEEAEEAWEKRKPRIVRENLFIVLYKLDGVTVEQLKQLETVPCRGKVLLSAVPVPEIPWTIVIPPNMKAPNPYSFLDRNLFGIRRYEKYFDFVHWLNTGSVSA